MGCQIIGTSHFISGFWSRWSKKKINGTAGLSHFHHPPFFALSLSAVSIHFRPTPSIVMPTSRARCHGCGRVFVPRGLSHHVNKSRDPRCRNALRTSRERVASLSIQHSATPPLLTPNNAAPISNDVELNGAYYAENIEGDFAAARGAFSRLSILHYYR